MRLREAVVSVPLHLGGLNHNQLRRSGQSQIINEPIDNRNENSSSKTLTTTTTTTATATNITTGEAEEETEETTTWSSIAIARDNVLLETANNTRNNVNNNLITPRLRRNSSVESITDCEGRHSSPEDSSHDLSPSEWSDWSEEGNLPAGCRVIVNPNYPGFQHLGPSLLSDTDDEHDSTELNEIDTQSKNTQQNDNFFNNNNNNNNNNVQDSINHLCEQNKERKFFYEKPKFNIQTVTSLYENVVPAAEKCINYVNSIEPSKIDEDIFFGDLINLSETETDQETKKRNSANIVDSSTVESKNISLNPFTILPELEIVNDVVEAETYLTHLEPDEGLADSVSENTKNQLSTATLKNKIDREVAVEVEIVELSTSVKETLQFPEIEEIPDSGKTSEFGETEDFIVEPIDLIREAKELPPIYQSKIGNHVTVSKTGRLVDDNTSTSSGANSDSEDCGDDQQPSYTKLEEIDLLSSIGPGVDIDLDKYVQPSVPDVVVAMETVAVSPRVSLNDNNRLKQNHINEQDTNKLMDRNLSDSSTLDSRKKDKMTRNQAKRKQHHNHHHHHHQSRSTTAQRRPDKRKTENNNDNGPGGFDVYNIETAMPKIDLDAIESHLRAAREEERRRRNDREEIRRRLAMGPDAEDLRAERGRKPSLQSRLQSGMNLQICFMNETPSDTESPSSENDLSPGPTPILNGSKQKQAAMRPQVLSLPSLRLDTWGPNSAPIDEADFFARQARLQTEARMALAQAKEMAHMQMEVERQRLKQSPITEMVRSSLEKVGVQLGETRRRLSRVLLTDLNVAQLQVVANDLHARIATLNEALVEGLLRRDDLHMEQDSMLVDVEDLTRYLGAKQETLKKKQTAREQHQQNSTPTRNNHQQSTKSRLKMTNRSLVSLVRK